MTTTLHGRQEVVIQAPELRGAALELGRCRDLECLLDGPAGTGKSYGALFKVNMMLTLYPGSKWLLARKTNTALAGSAVATYRELLHPSENVRFFGGNKIKPAAFEYPNGSQLIVNGLDKPDKVKSWEFDGAMINECSECSVEDIEFVRSRLRHGKGPYHQLIMDTNPDAPTHWLNVRCNEGLTTRLLSRHEDNPRLFDTKTNDWTQEGRRYIFEVLGGLTGVRLARLRYGIWAAAEGTVYEQAYDRAKNVIDRFPIPLDWPRYLAVDFGYTNPFVCLWAARDPDGRLYIYRQLYKTKVLVEDHAKEIKRVSRWGQDGGDPLPREIITDHAAQERMTLERHLGLMTIPAHKTILDGIQAMASQLKPAGDGRPRLMIFRDSLLERDRDLAQAKQPTCLEDEMEVYAYRQGPGIGTKEEPIDAWNHAADAARYLVARFSLRPTDIKYSSRIY